MRVAEFAHTHGPAKLKLCSFSLNPPFIVDFGIFPLKPSFSSRISPFFPAQADRSTTEGALPHPIQGSLGQDWTAQTTTALNLTWQGVKIGDRGGMP